jgi:four helix bundle protein
MHDTLRLQVLGRIADIVARVRPLVEAIRHQDRDLASQLQRALNSVGLNVAEGFGTQAGNARLRFRTARGSAYEVQAALKLAAAWGYVAAEDCAAVVGELDRLAARLWGLGRR